jgi:hypothetical protein
MTQEEKQLLLVDLCARLPYGVQYKDAHGYKKTLDIWSPEFHTALNTILYDGKPSLYLRPMSSMTEEEKKELSKKYNWRIGNGQIQIRYHSQGCWDDETECPTEEYIILFDWLNKHYFDYRGLIEKGLAIEAPNNMYKFDSNSKSN